MKRVKTDENLTRMDAPVSTGDTAELVPPQSPVVGTHSPAGGAQSPARGTQSPVCTLDNGTESFSSELSTSTSHSSSNTIEAMESPATNLKAVSKSMEEPASKFKSPLLQQILNKRAAHGNGKAPTDNEKTELNETSNAADRVGHEVIEISDTPIKIEQL